jgi:hypothetical protein
MCEQGDIGARIFAREICFSADDEVGGREMIQGGEDLGRVECWIQWDLYVILALLVSQVNERSDQYRPELKQCVCGLGNRLASYTQIMFA